MSFWKRMMILFAALVLLLPAAFAREEGSTLRIRAFKIGKADAYLLRTDNAAVLLDGGELDDGEEILEYLDEKGISKLDVLIVSHFDKRSIGGLPEILGKVTADRVLVPDYVKDGNKARLLFAALEGLKVEKVSKELSFELDGMSFTLYPARSDSYTEDDDNDFSLVVSLRHGEGSFLFPGDIMSERINEMLEDKQLTPHQILKMPCHGQNIDGIDKLLDAVQPAIAIIPASEKNPPAGALLSNLTNRNIRWYATMHGSVNITSDNYNVTVRQKVKAPAEEIAP